MSSRTTNDDDGARSVTHPFMPGWPLNWHCVRFHHPESAESAELCASDRAILDLEESWQAGSLSVDKETAIRDSLGLSSPDTTCDSTSSSTTKRPPSTRRPWWDDFSGFAASNAAPVAHNCSDDTYDVGNDAT